MEIKSEKDYRNVYMFLHWMHEVFKSGWPPHAAGLLSNLEAEVAAWEERYHPQAKKPGFQTMCRDCDHAHTGPMTADEVPYDGPMPPSGRSCMLCGCKVRK